MIDAAALLGQSGIAPTPVRLGVLEAMAETPGATTARDILAKVEARLSVNKVTLYRVLDLFIRHGLAVRHGGGDRAFRYCLGRHAVAGDHGHAYCTRCGRTVCLPGRDEVFERLRRDAGRDMLVEHVEVRVDGVCRDCRGLSGQEAASGPDRPFDAGC